MGETAEERAEEEAYLLSLREERDRASLSVLSSAFSPCGRFLAAGRSDGRVAVWRTDESLQRGADPPGPLVFEALPGSAVCGLAFAGGGSALVACGEGGAAAWAWDPEAAARGEAPRRGARLADVGGVHAVAADGGADAVLAATADGSLARLTLDGARVAARVAAHAAAAHCVAPAAGGAVWTASEDGTAALWDLRSPGPPVSRVNPAAGAECAAGAGGPYLSCLATDETGDWMACGGGSRFVTLWHTPSRAVVSTMPSSCVPQALAWYDGTVLAGYNERHVVRWSPGGRRVGRLAASSKLVWSLAVNRASPTRELAVTGITARVDVFLNASTAALGLDAF